jgi:hypothetical protein
MPGRSIRGQTSQVNATQSSWYPVSDRHSGIITRGKSHQSHSTQSYPLLCIISISTPPVFPSTRSVTLSSNHSHTCNRTTTTPPLQTQTHARTHNINFTVWPSKTILLALPAYKNLNTCHPNKKTKLPSPPKSSNSPNTTSILNSP